MASPSITAAELAQQSDWVRGLVRSMVRDEHLAEDLAQDALIAGLQSGSATIDDPRRWLKGVIRNLTRQEARTRSRRIAREDARGAEQLAPPTSDLVARVETQQAVAQAVLRLPEPTRTVLLLRFFESLPVRRISEQESMPVERVKYQLRRGQKLLREELRTRLGPNWAGLVLPLALPSASSLLIPASIALMNQKALVFTGVLILALASTLYLLPDGDDSPAGLAHTAAGVTELDEPLTANRGVQDEVIQRTSAEPEEPAMATATRSEHSGIIVDAENQLLPIDGVLACPKLWAHSIPIAEGRFELPVDLSKSDLGTTQAEDYLVSGAVTGPARPTLVFHATEESAEAVLRLRLADSVHYPIVVEDHYGNRVADARIRVAAPYFLNDAAPVLTDAEGRAEISVRSSLGEARIRVDAPGFSELSRTLKSSDAEREVSLRLDRLYVLGLAVDHRYRTLLSWSVGRGERGAPQESQVPAEERSMLHQAEQQSQVQPWETVTWIVLAERGPRSVPDTLGVDFRVAGEDVHNVKLAPTPLSAENLSIYRMPEEAVQGRNKLAPCVLELSPAAAFATTPPDSMLVTFELRDVDPQEWGGMVYGPGVDSGEGPVYFTAVGQRKQGTTYQFWLPTTELAPKSERPSGRHGFSPYFLAGQSIQVQTEGTTGRLLLHPDEVYAEVALVDAGGFRSDLPATLRSTAIIGSMSIGPRKPWPQQLWLRPGSYSVMLRHGGRQVDLANTHFPAPLTTDGVWLIEIDPESAGVDLLNVY